MIETSTLIVGGGPVGLGLGLELSRHGIDSVIIERNTSTTEHPKSHGTTARTMEDFRIWGVEQAVIEGGIIGPDVVWACESITGRLIGTTVASPPNIHSPCSKLMVAQDVVERAGVPVAYFVTALSNHRLAPLRFLNSYIHHAPGLVLKVT